MALSQRLDLRQTQALVMTPQLQQAIKLLQMSNIELAGFVEQELEQNPLLDRDESEPEGGPVAVVERDTASPDEAMQARSEQAGLGTAEPPLAGEDVDQWDAASGSEGEGDFDLAGDPEAWRQRNGRQDEGVDSLAG